MDKLQEMVAHKRREVEENKALYPVKLLERSLFFEARPVSLKKYILREDLSGVIAEFKRRSPSRGVINEFADPGKTCLGYMQAGASALSVLTDQRYFGGGAADLEKVRELNYCPVLRKDFIIDAYQVIESRSMGADAILLIAGLLDERQLRELSERAFSLGMEVLFEIHKREEIGLLPAGAELVGVNNRNLKDLSVDGGSALALAGSLPAGIVPVAESGIESPEMLLELRRAGYRGFLIGERFMREADPAAACRAFIKKTKRLSRCS
jgi:indole-3-glycerol phosphate synthase